MNAEEGLPSSEARSRCWKGLCSSHCSPLPSLSPQNRAVPVPTSPQCCLWEQGGHPNRAGFFHRLFQPQAWISLAKSTSICSLPPALRSTLGSPSCRLSPNLAPRMLRGCCQGILPQAQQQGSSRTLYPPLHSSIRGDQLSFTARQTAESAQSSTACKVCPPRQQGSSSHPETRHK